MMSSLDPSLQQSFAELYNCALSDGTELEQVQAKYDRRRD
jgi:hypothetical protein